jgi:hypothetical protein
MTVRAKFTVTSKQDWFRGGKVELTPVYSTDPNHENKTFWDATPSGKIELGINNPDAYAQFSLGLDYYVDFTKAPLS